MDDEKDAQLFSLEEFAEEVIPPRQTVIHTWDEPSLRKKAVTVRIKGHKMRPIDFSLDKFQKFDPIMLYVDINYT